MPTNTYLNDDGLQLIIFNEDGTVLIPARLEHKTKIIFTGFHKIFDQN